MTEVTVPEAVESYLTERSTELSDSSIQNHRYQLKRLKEWCAGPGDIDTIEEFDPIDLSRFRRARSEDINSNTMYNQLGVVRLFLRFAHRMGWVEESLPDSIVLPTRDGRARDSSLDPDRASNILDKLETYRYASFDHCLMVMLWTCGMRIGTIRSLDITDFHLDEGWVEVVHRPDQGTSLKNSDGSTREVNLHGWVCDVLRAWIEDRRPAGEDAHSREPLFLTSKGRAARATLRRRVNRLTDCGNLDPGCDCDITYASKCSESVSPHDIRRSSISAWLDKGNQPELVSQRCDVSKSTIDVHYDVRSEKDKRELRRDEFDM